MQIQKALMIGVASIGSMLASGQAATIALAPSTTATAAEGPGDLRDPKISEFTVRSSAADARFKEDYEAIYSNDIGDALIFAPGVYTNAHDIHEPRISIRGFGLGNRQQRSGIAVYRDGAPLTDVHGVTNAFEVDLLAVDGVEVLRGGGGDLRLSGDTLGGAVNFVSPTGRDREGAYARADAGVDMDANPIGRGHIESAGARDGFDYFASLTGLYEEGSRDNNRRDAQTLNANIGIHRGASLRTRFFLEVVRSNAELAGGLTPAELDIDPTEPMSPTTIGPLFPGGPTIFLSDGARQDDFARDMFVARLANVTNFRFLSHDFEVGAHYARRDVEAPQVDAIGIIDEQGSEWGARLALAKERRMFGMDGGYRVGGSYSAGGQSSDRFENLLGVAGFQTADTEQKSANVNIFVEGFLKPLKRMVVDFGAKYIMVDRELTNLENDDFEELRYTGVSARAGVFYELTKKIGAFANLARTYQPPSLSELIAGDPENFAMLEEQDSLGFELGLRGDHGDRLRWSLTYFNTDIENEIVNVTDPESTGLAGTLVNVDSTTHKGVEAGLTVNLLPGMTAKNGRGLLFKGAYSYNNFRFTSPDPIPVPAGNRMAGTPQHVFHGELKYDEDGRWYVAGNIKIAAGDFFADHENLVSAPTYTLFGFTAGYRLNDQIELFASGENLTDVAYAAGVTPITSQATQNARLFTPGRQRAVFAGVRYRF